MIRVSSVGHSKRRSVLWQAFRPRFWQSLLRGLFGFFRSGKRHAHLHRFRLFYRLRVETVLRPGWKLLDWPQSRIRVWVDGEELFPRLQRLIRSAQRSIVIQMFIWKDDTAGREIASLLLEAAERGVSIDITKEAIGDGFELAEDFLSTQSSRTAPWPAFWSHPRITIHHIAQRDHTKAFVIDGRILLLGGMNIGDEYRDHWHDYFVEIRSRRFVTGFLSDTDTTSAKGSLSLILNTRARKEVRRRLTDLLLSARSRILLEQAYLSDPAMIDLLAARSRDGIIVTIIVPAHPDIHAHANRSALAALLRKGDPRRLRIFLYPRMLHGKLVLIDKQTAFLGSTNFTTSSLDWLGEANVLIGRVHALALFRLRAAVRYDLSISTPLQGQPRIGWVGKVLAWIGL